MVENLGGTTQLPACGDVSPSNLVERLRCSSTLRQPSLLEREWFDLRAPPGLESAPAGDSAGATAGATAGAIAAGVRARSRRASLSLLLREVEGKVEMLVIKRVVNPRDKWSGHIALPGGRHEAGETELQTAVRECQEEVGISLVSSRFELLGRLGDSRTSTSKDALTVSCFVFVQTDKAETPVTVQPSEVAFAWWVDTAMFYPDPVKREAGFPVTGMVKVARKPHWKALMWLLGAETVFFPCFFLPPPPLLGQPAGHDSTTASICVDYPFDAKTFVMWGMTYGVVSRLAVAGGGDAFARPGPPPFRFNSIGADFLVQSFYMFRRWGSGLSDALSSSLAALRLRQ